MPAVDALKARGGHMSAIRQARQDYWRKPLSEIANLAAKGDQDADTILKLIKEAAKKAQKYKGK